MPKVPSYRTRAGYARALVTLADSATGKRKDYWLGQAKTPQSREAYFRLIAEWEGLGRRLPETPPPQSISREQPRSVGADSGGAPDGGPTVGEIVLACWRWVAANHRSVRASNIKAPLRLLRRLDSTTPAAAFGPKKLRTLRDCMVLGDESAVPPRKPWSRRAVNERVQTVVAMFRWAVAQEMIPPSVPQALAMVEPFKRGRTTAREGARVRPVAQSLVDAVRPLVSAQVRAMIDLQLLSGARSGEIVGLRAADIDTSAGDTWVYRPAAHKTAFRGIERRVRFGPRAQAVLAPFKAGRPNGAPLFSPAEAEGARRERAHAARRILALRRRAPPMTFPLRLDSVPAKARMPRRDRTI